MKRIILNYLVITTLVVSAVFMSCNKCGCDDYIGDEIKLLKTISYGIGGYEKYEYDAQNRISQISHHFENGDKWSTETFIYRENDLITVVRETADFYWLNRTTEFVNNGDNTITMTERNGDNISVYTILLSNEYPTKVELIDDLRSVCFTYDYLNGNMTMFQSYTSGDDSIDLSAEYLYDDNKSPFYFCQTPKWYMFHAFYTRASNNNVIEIITDNITAELEYEYDHAGFPIKCTRKNVSSGDNDNELILYEYKILYR